MALWPFVVGALALFNRPKTPKPPDWQTNLGQLTSQLAQRYLPTTLRELYKQALGPAGESLYMQQVRQALANQQAAGARALATQLAGRGLMAPETLAGALAAYQAYAGRNAAEAISQAALQDQAIRSQALQQLAQLTSGTSGQALQAGTLAYQQQVAAQQLAAQQEEALALALAPFLAELFRKKTKAKTPVATAPVAQTSPVAPSFYTLGQYGLPSATQLLSLGLYGLAGLM